MSSTLAPPPPTPTPDERGAPARLTPGGLVVLLVALFVATLDFFVVNVALPSMQRDLGAGDGVVTAWVAAYGAGFAGFLVLGSRLGDRHGRRRAFVAGLALFTLASAACGLAPDAVSLLAFRIVQGLGAAIALPQVLTTITATTDGAARSRALGIYGLTAGVAAISGQLVGGALIDLDLVGLGWRWCFLVNVPVGLVAVPLARRLVPETGGDATSPIDAPSVALLGAGLCLLVVPLALGRQTGWPLWCVGGLVAGVDLLATFAVRQRLLRRRGRTPLVDLSALRERTLGLGTAVVLALQAGIASSFLVLAIALQAGLGLDPLEAGLVFTILAVGYVASSVAAPALLQRVGPLLLVEGAALTVVGQVLLALLGGDLAPGGSIAPLVPGLLVAGVGMGLQFGPSVTVALSGVRADRAGEASGIVTTTQQLGGALGVALLGIVFYGALDAGGVAHAFVVASWCLAGLGALVGVLGLGLRARAS